MSDTVTWLSRDQQAQIDFSQAILRLRPYLASLPEGPPALDAMTEAALRFGTCELQMRRSERLRKLKLAEAEASRLVDSALANHERGLLALPAVRTFAEAVAGQPPDDQTLSQWRDYSPTIRRESREQLGELDLSADDAGHLARIFDECYDAIDEGGLSGLGRNLSTRLEELDDVRRSLDRGTRAASFPWWKIVAAGAIVGLTAYAVWTLLASGAPWWNFFLVALVACIMMLCVAMGC
jgi:hypothetical protein